MMDDGKKYLDLLRAIKSGNLQELKQLIRDTEANILDKTTQEGNTALHMAARFGHKLLVLEMVDKRPSLTFQTNNKGETPVHIAARAGKRDLVEYFIKAMEGYDEGIHIGRMRDKFGNTPLHGSARNAHFKVVLTLAKNDPESLRGVNDAGESPLLIAIDMKLTYFAAEIIRLNPDTLLDMHWTQRQTPLHVAVKRNDFEIMKMILESKPDLVKKQDERKRTPLHYAAALGHQRMVEELFYKDPMVAYDSDINEKIPLHLAAENGQVSLVRVLLEPCWDTIEKVDDNHRNILHLAAMNGNEDVVKYILNVVEMVDLINSPDVDGNTPLHLAAAKYHSDVVAVLSNISNVKIWAVNNSNRTALAIVKLSTHDRGMELQKYFTLKVLKRAYKRKFINAEDVFENQQSDVEKVEISAEFGDKSRQMAQMILVMSTLLATFTFTAAFTIPGGYRSDGPHAGLATLISKAAFQAFVICDSVAMTTSITATVIVLWISSSQDTVFFMDTLPIATGLTWISLITILVAFVTGLFVVLQETLWLAILVCAIGCAAPFFLFIFTPIAVLVYEKVTKSRTSLSETQKMGDDSPFLYIVRLFMIFVQRKSHSLCRNFKIMCRRIGCHL